MDWRNPLTDEKSRSTEAVTAKVNIAVIGYGYWGPKLVRNFRNNPNCGAVDICDSDPELAANGRQEFPGIRVFSHFDDALDAADIDAVAIATPVSSHFSLVKKALEADKHVLVEKPMAMSLREAKELVELAEEKKRVLMVDHTFVYHPAVRKIKEFIRNGTLGNLHYIDSTRINLGLFQHDVNVLWDLAVHDVSIIRYLTDDAPETVQAIGVSHTQNAIENIGYLIMRYASGLLVHVNCSWISPVKIRHTLIGGDKKMIVYNDLDNTEPVKVYDSGYHAKTDEEIQRMLYEYRVGDVYSPHIEPREALADVVNDFLTSILRKENPVSDGRFGMEVIRILEAAQKSIKSQGVAVPLV